MSGIVKSGIKTFRNAAGQIVDAAGNIYDDAGNIIANAKGPVKKAGAGALGEIIQEEVLDPLKPIVEEFETGAEKIGDVIQGEIPDPTAPGAFDFSEDAPTTGAAGGGPAGSEDDPAPTVADEDADEAAQEAFAALMRRFGRRQTLLGGEGEANVFRQTLLGG